MKAAGGTDFIPVRIRVFGTGWWPQTASLGWSIGVGYWAQEGSNCHNQIHWQCWKNIISGAEVHPSALTYEELNIFLCQ